MRFNAIIAATILAAAVSGAAIVNPAPGATEVADATTDTTESTFDGPSAEDLANFPEDVYYVEEGEKDEGTVEKRNAEAEAGDWVWSPKWRPIGLPVGNRDAEAQPEAKAGDRVWSPKWRPVGLPVGKRDAEAQPDANAGNWVWSPKWRPVGLPVGKRDAQPEAEAEAGNWVWSPKWRPVGLPVGKRDAEQ